MSNQLDTLRSLLSGLADDDPMRKEYERIIAKAERAEAAKHAAKVGEQCEEFAGVMADAIAERTEELVGDLDKALFNGARFSVAMKIDESGELTVEVGVLKSSASTRSADGEPHQYSNPPTDLEEEYIEAYKRLGKLSLVADLFGLNSTGTISRALAKGRQFGKL